MLDGPSKSVGELKSHLRLLNALNPKGVYFRDDTAGAVARLYKKFKRAARRGRNDALFSSVMDKFQSVHYAAVRLCRGERKEKAERAAFEICRHTLMAFGDGEILALCADVFGKDLPFLAALRDELEIKKCQLFCLAAWHILSVRKRPPKNICPRFSAVKRQRNFQGRSARLKHGAAKRRAGYIPAEISRCR